MTANINPARASIIIPAYNEANTILACLLPLSQLADRYNIVVSCNGCTDNTADIARSASTNITVIESTKASKVGALNRAEQLGLGFPRIYIDADVKTCKASIEALLAEAELHPCNTLIVPRSEMDFSGSSPCVKRYYREWYRSDFVTKAGFGSGIYVLTRHVRAQFNDWPELVADDNFIRQFFSIEQIRICKAATSVVKAPTTMRQLIAIKTRSKYGNIELAKAASGFNLTTPLRYQPRAHIDSVIYLIVNLIAAIKAKKMYRQRSFTWLRDTSHR